MFCRKCGKEIPDDSEFCYKCGAKMIAEALDEQKIEQTKPEDSSLPVCSKCGKPIPEGNMFCPSCGTDIPSVEIVSEKAPALKKRSKKGMIIGIVAAAAVAVFAAIFIPIQVNVHKNPFPEFEYHLDDEGRYTIDKYMGNETDVVVPDAIKDKPVYTITEGAFSGSGISSVQLGKDVRIIGGGAFADCKNLEKVAFSYEDTDNSDNLLISDQAFKNCSKLKSVDFPIVAIHIFSEAFYNCSSLAEIDLSLTLSIGDSAFENCSSLFSVRTMNVEFTPRCFANCSSLYMVRCESCGNLIARQAFSGCTNLTVFTVAEKEYSYPSELENAGIVVGAGAFKGCDEFDISKHMLQYTFNDFENKCMDEVANMLGVKYTQTGEKEYSCEGFPTFHVMGKLFDYTPSEYYGIVFSMEFSNENIWLTSNGSCTDEIHLGMTYDEIMDILSREDNRYTSVNDNILNSSTVDYSGPMLEIHFDDYGVSNYCRIWPDMP